MTTSALFLFMLFFFSTFQRSIGVCSTSCPRFKNSLAKDLVDAVVLHNERWSFVKINFSWLKIRHGLSSQLTLYTKGPNLPLWHSGTSAFEPFVPSVAQEIAQEPLLKKMRCKTLC